MKNILIIIALATTGFIANAQQEVPLTFECIPAHLHIDELYQTKTMICEDGELSISDEDPCADIYFEDGFTFLVSFFKHEEDSSPIGTFGDVYIDDNLQGEKIVELAQARMMVLTPDHVDVQSLIVDVNDISQNGFVFGYNKPSQINFYESLEDLDEAFEHVHWNGSQLFIDEPVTEFQLGADHMKVKNITVNPEQSTVAVKTERAQYKMRAYPNPTNDIVSFDLGGAEMAELQMFDLQGRRVLQEKTVVNAKVLMTSLVPGIYLARATSTEGDIYVQKITKL